MGVYPQAVQVFAALNVPVIPTRADKPSMPMMRNPGKLGVRGSLTLASNPRFADANAGLWTGRRAGVTIVDIDSAEPTHLTDAIKTFGDTPFKVRTPSGGTHLYYRHNGEPRAVRPFGKAVPLDVLGNGLAVVPPSRRPPTADKIGGEYQIADGAFADIARLPSIRRNSLPDTPSGPSAALSDTMPGERDDALFRRACALARDADTEIELMNAVLAENAAMPQPLDKVQAHAKARSAWRYKVEGRLFVKGDRTAVLPLADIKDLADSPSVFLLLAFLRAHHLPGHVFAVVPEAVAPSVNMSANTVRKARGVLEAKGYLKRISTGGMTARGKEPNVYELTRG